MTADPLTTSQDWDLIGLTFGTLLACLLFVAIRARATLVAQDIKKQNVKLTSRMGQGQWDFSQSFATNIAVIGSVLTLVLTSAVLPSTTDILPNSAYGGLAVFFGSIVVIAPLFYNGTARRELVSPDEVDTAAEYHGTVWGFLLAALLTEWGLVGSIATVFVLLLELYYASALPIAPLILLAITLFASLIFFARYSWVKIDGTIGDQFDSTTKDARIARSTAIRAANTLQAPTQQNPPPSPRWTLL